MVIFLGQGMLVVLFLLIFVILTFLVNHFSKKSERKEELYHEANQNNEHLHHRGNDCSSGRLRPDAVRYKKEPEHQHKRGQAAGRRPRRIECRPVIQG
jgi:hypothetical protein